MIIYAWGDGYFLNIVFNAIASMFQNGNLNNAAYAVAIVVGTYHLLKHGLQHNLATILGKYLILIAAFSSFFTIQENVTIEDLGTGNTYPVNNVPFVVAMWGYGFSHLEYDLTALFDDAYETGTNAPASTAYSDAGFAFWPNLYANLPKLRRLAQSMPYLSFTYDNFIQNCVLPSMVQGRINMLDLETEPLSQAFSTVNSALDGEYMTTSGTVQSAGCQTVYNQLFGSNGYFTQFQNSDVTSFIHDTMFPSYSSTQIQNLMGDSSSVSNYFLNISADINSLAAEAVETDLLADSLVSSSASDPTMASYISTMTLIKQIQERSTIAELGKRWIPVIHQIIETIFYGVMPIFSLMLLTPMAGKVLLSILEFGLWLSFWGPLFAILNMIVNVYAQKNFEPYTQSAQLQLSAYLISNVIHGANDISSLAASLSWTVPVIAFALASGSTYALAQLPGAIQGMVTGVGSQTAMQVSNPEALASNPVAQSAGYAGLMGQSIFNPNVSKQFLTGFQAGGILSSINSQAQMKAINTVGGQAYKQALQAQDTYMAGNLMGREQGFNILNLKPQVVGEMLGEYEMLSKADNVETIQQLANALHMSESQLINDMAHGQTINATINGERYTIQGVKQKGGGILIEAMHTVSNETLSDGLKVMSATEIDKYGTNHKLISKTLQGTFEWNGHTETGQVVIGSNGKILSEDLKDNVNVNNNKSYSTGTTYQNPLAFLTQLANQKMKKQEEHQFIGDLKDKPYVALDLEKALINAKELFTKDTFNHDVGSTSGREYYQGFFDVHNKNLNAGKQYSKSNHTSELVQILRGSKQDVITTIGATTPLGGLKYNLGQYLKTDKSTQTGTDVTSGITISNNNGIQWGSNTTYGNYSRTADTVMNKFQQDIIADNIKNMVNELAHAKTYEQASEIAKEILDYTYSDSVSPSFYRSKK